MTTILEVFDPAMCCSTGVCGPDVDPRLVNFSADLDWLKSHSVDVRRYNLAHQPMEFANQAMIKELLTTTGTSALPAIVVNGALVSHARYPGRGELAAMAGLRADIAQDAKSPAAMKPGSSSGCCSSSSEPVNIGIKAKSKTSCCGG